MSTRPPDAAGFVITAVPSALTSAIGYGRFHGSRDRPPVAASSCRPRLWPEHSSRWPTRMPAASRSQSSRAQPCSWIERREEERGVGDPAGDHDVGALRERVGDRERAEVRRREQRRRRAARRTARRCRGSRARSRRRRAASRAGSCRSSPSTVAIFRPEMPSALRGLDRRVRGRGRVDAARVGDDLRAPVDDRGQRRARGSAGRSRVYPSVSSRCAVLLQDRERQLGERFEAEVVDALGEQPVDRASACRRRSPARRRAGRRAGSGMDAGSPVGPRRRGLELRRDLEQQVLAAVRGDEVHADRQPVRAPGRSAARSRAGRSGWRRACTA